MNLNVCIALSIKAINFMRISMETTTVTATKALVRSPDSLTVHALHLALHFFGKCFKVVAYERT